MRHQGAAVAGTARGRSGALGALVPLVVLFGAVPAAAQFSAQPVILEMRTDAAAAATSVSIRNESEGPLQLRVYGADFEQPPEGGHAFLDSGTHPRSCADRLRFYPDNLVLAAREIAEVRVLMEPGVETCWSLVFVESAGGGQTGIRISQRIGVKVYGVSTTAVSEGEVAGVEVAADEGAATRTALIDFRNLGAAPLRPEGEIELRTEVGEIVAVVPVAPFSVLPGRVRRISVPIEVDLPPGRYLAIPILDFGGDYLAGGQVPFTIGG